MSNIELKDQKPLCVLWVDDESQITELFKIWVEAIGHKCCIVNSGKEALKHLDNNTCDIVFTDIGMPEMNGWELADAIRNKFENKIKIAAVTGWDIEEKDKKEHGIDFVLQKPFALDELKKLLQTI